MVFVLLSGVEKAGRNDGRNNAALARWWSCNAPGKGEVMGTIMAGKNHDVCM